MEDSLYQSILSRIADKGYDTSRLVPTTHLHLHDTATGSSISGDDAAAEQTQQGSSTTDASGDAKKKESTSTTSEKPQNSDGGLWWLQGIFSSPQNRKT